MCACLGRIHVPYNILSFHVVTSFQTVRHLFHHILLGCSHSWGLICHRSLLPIKKTPQKTNDLISRGFTCLDPSKSFGQCQFCSKALDHLLHKLAAWSYIMNVSPPPFFFWIEPYFPTVLTGRMLLCYKSMTQWKFFLPRVDIKQKSMRMPIQLGIAC